LAGRFKHFLDKYIIEFKRSGRETQAMEKLTVLKDLGDAACVDASA